MEETGATTQSRYADDLYCPDCGYSLRGLTSERCPECGLRLDFIESEVSLIPWERRRELGRIRAYWQTVLMVLTRTKILCRAMYRPLSYTDAQRFRWLSALHGYIPLLLMLPAVHWANPKMLAWAADYAGTWFVALACVCDFFALLAFTGLPSYFFHPRHLSPEQQDRAVALSYYGCAGLVFAPLVFGIAFTVYALWDKKGEPALAMATAAVLVPFNLFLCWNSWSLIARYALRRTASRFLVTWLVPLLWLFVCPLVLVIPCAVAYFVAVVLCSL